MSMTRIEGNCDGSCFCAEEPEFENIKRCMEMDDCEGNGVCMSVDTLGPIDGRCGNGDTCFRSEGEELEPFRR